jgi:predicted nuclease with TOPRIM domain
LNGINAKPRKSKYQLERERAKLEERITTMEKRKAELEQLLSSNDTTDYKILKDRASELADILNALDDTTMQWLEVQEESNAM